MKKQISLLLSLILIISTFNSHTFSISVPTDINDKCTGVHNLESGDLITRSPKWYRSVCGCKTCTVDAITYERLKEFLEMQVSLENLKKKNEALILYKQNNINKEAIEHAGFQVVLIGSSVAARFFDLYPNLKKKFADQSIGFKVCAIITLAGAVVGLVTKTINGHDQIVLLENQIKFKNLKYMLRNLSEQIEKKGFKSNNFLFISQNYDPIDMYTYVAFKNRSGITYDKKTYNEAFFNDLNKNIIKPALKNFDDISTFEDESKYDYTYRDMMKNLYKITLPLFAVNNAFAIYKASGSTPTKEYLQNLNIVNSALIGCIIEQVFKPALENNQYLKDLFENSKQKFVDIYIDKKSLKSGNESNAVHNIEL